MPLIPCSRCGCHVLNDASEACPHCGSEIGRAAARTAAAVLLGLSLAGCGGDTDGTDPTTMEPEYGVTVTTPTGDTGDSR